MLSFTTEEVDQDLDFKPERSVMKTFFASLLFLALSSSVVSASPNSYAPRLQDVGVLFEPMELDYLPRIYHYILGEALELEQSSNCPRVSVDRNDRVYCVSDYGQKTEVGVLGSQRHQVETTLWRSVNWDPRKVKIQERIHPRFGYLYSLILVK